MSGAARGAAAATALAALAACLDSSTAPAPAAAAPDSSAPPAPTAPGPGGGGLPTPGCGEARSGETLGCGRLDLRASTYCSELTGANPFLSGSCFAPLSTGSLAANVGGAPFAASHVGARLVANGSALEVVGLVGPADADRRAGSAIRILGVGRGAGTYTCGANSLASVTLSERVPDVQPLRDQVAFGERGACTVTLATSGEVGSEVSGAFTASLLRPDGTTVDVTEGTFAIRLGP